MKKRMVDTLGLSIGDPVMFFTCGGQVGIRKYMPGCVFCGEVDNAVVIGKIM